MTPLSAKLRALTVPLTIVEARRFGHALPALADLIEAAEAMANADERPFSTRAMRIEKIRAALARLDEVMR